MTVLVEWKVHSKTTFFTSVGLPSHNMQIKKNGKILGSLYTGAKGHDHEIVKLIHRLSDGKLIEFCVIKV